MDLMYNLSVVIAQMASQFPQQNQVGLGLTDQMRDLTPNAVEDRTDFKVDSALFCAYAQPYFIPHNQVSGGSSSGSSLSPSGIIDDGMYIRAGLPSITWSTIAVSGPYAIQAFAARPWSFQHYDILCTDETQQNSMALIASADLDDNDCQGFTAILTTNHWQYVDPYAGQPSYWEVRWVITSPDTDEYDWTYSVVGGTSNLGKLRLSNDDGVTWVDLNAKISYSDNPAKQTGNSDPESNNDTMVISVLALNNKMTVAIGGPAGAVTIEMPENTPYPFITQIQVRSQNWTQFGWSVHPMKFASDAQMISNQKQLGFVPDDIYYTATGLEGGYNLQSGDYYTEILGNVSVTTIDLSANPQYQIDIANPIDGTYEGVNYSDTTAAISRVTLRTDQVSTIYNYSPMPLEVQQVVENISFDPNTLAISHTMQVTVDNFQGITSLYQTYGLRGYGNMGIAMRMGWDHMPNGPDGGIGWQHFYGFINEYLYQRGAGGDSKLVLNCVDQMQQMADVLIAAPTDLDGWNHYSAMAYLWMYGGVTPAQLAFAGLVPTIDGGTLLSDPSGSIDPFGVSPDDPTPGGYFLPYGQGMHPWTPRDRTLPVLSLMEFVRKTTGYLNYIDAQGYARYEQWIPPSAGVTKKVYDEYAYDGYGQPGGEVNELFGMTARIGTANTRNRTILIGIDAFGPEWAPIVESRQDDASIFTDPSVTPPQNYIGYEKAFIWLDARFANEEYASAAADFIFAINRLPDYDVTCQAWLQPEIFPLDTIMVNDWRSNSAGIPFYVMSVQNTLSVLSGNLVLTTTLTGKFLI